MCSCCGLHTAGPAATLTGKDSDSGVARKAGKLWDQGRRGTAQFLAGKYNGNTLNILVHFQLLCTQRGEEFGFSWRMESIL